MASLDYPPFNPGLAARELRAACEGIEWALPLISTEAAHRVPSSGDWSVAMNLAHVVVYEERVAIPILGALADAEDGAERVPSGDEDWLENGAAALERETFARIADRFRRAAAEHVHLLGVFDEKTFNDARCSLWTGVGSLVPAGWVTKKSVQHIWEHGHVVMRAGWLAYGRAMSAPA